MELHQAFLAAGEALLIGFLIGAQREVSREETEQQPGVRDFTLIALVGAFCGFIDRDWVIAAALLAVVSLLAVYHHRTVGRSGITTEIAAVATFFLGYLTATPRIQNGTLLAVALTVRGDSIRVITAYDIDADQKRRYQLRSDYDEQTEIQAG